MNAVAHATPQTAMAASAEDAAKALLRGQLQTLIGALDRGDDAAFADGLEALVRASEQSLFADVARITRELHDAMRSLQLDAQLARIADDDIPDARSRLDYVIRITEAAAHQTLDLVERGGSIAERLAELSALARAATAGPAELGDRIDAQAIALRGTLTELSQAQIYQDLSGQIIGKIIKLVGSVEHALLELLRAGRQPLQSGQELPIAPVNVAQNARSLLERSGPGARDAASQEDADDLLARLGF